MKPSFSAEVQKGAIQGAMHPRCNGAKPYIEGCTIVAPISPPEVQSEKSEEGDPLAHPNVVRIRLSEAASAALAAVGRGAFMIACPGSYPDSAGRYVIHAAPIAWQAACDASKVLLGTHRAVRVRPATTPQTSAGSNTPSPATDAPQANLDASPDLAI